MISSYRATKRIETTHVLEQTERQEILRPWISATDFCQALSSVKLVITDTIQVATFLSFEVLVNVLTSRNTSSFLSLPNCRATAKLKLIVDPH